MQSPELRRPSGTLCPTSLDTSNRACMLLPLPCRAAGAPLEADPHAGLPRLHHARLPEQDVRLPALSCGSWLALTACSLQPQPSCQPAVPVPIQCCDTLVSLASTGGHPTCLRPSDLFPAMQHQAGQAAARNPRAATGHGGACRCREGAPVNPPRVELSQCISFPSSSLLTLLLPPHVVASRCKCKGG